MGGSLIFWFGNFFNFLGQQRELCALCLCNCNIISTFIHWRLFPCPFRCSEGLTLPSHQSERMHTRKGSHTWKQRFICTHKEWHLHTFEFLFILWTPWCTDAYLCRLSWELDSPLAGQHRVGHSRCQSVSLCPAINRCHLTVQSARGHAEQPAGYQGRPLLSMEAANRISDQWQKP